MVLYPTVKTPIVSRYSAVFGISKIDLHPAVITMQLDLDNYYKSAEIS